MLFQTCLVLHLWTALAAAPAEDADSSTASSYESDYEEKDSVFATVQTGGGQAQSNTTQEQQAKNEIAKQVHGENESQTNEEQARLR